MTQRVFYIVIAIISAFLTACEQAPSPALKLIPCSDLPQWGDFSWVPVILVGTIAANKRIGPSKVISGPNYGTSVIQLFHITVHVENVLKGNVKPGTNVPIFYFTDLGSIGGPRRLGLHEVMSAGMWHFGDREIFFLKRDSGVLRTLCDISENSVFPVYSGAHPELIVDKPLPQLITEILLTRGEGSTDALMVKAIHHYPIYDWPYTLKRLQGLASDDSPGVRKEACLALADVGRPCREPF